MKIVASKEIYRCSLFGVTEDEAADTIMCGVVWCGVVCYLWMQFDSFLFPFIRIRKIRNFDFATVRDVCLCF